VLTGLRERSELFEHEKKVIKMLKTSISEKVTGFILKFKLQLIGKINIKMVALFFGSKIPNQRSKCKEMNYIFVKKKYHQF
jgi:hypothetical protein